MRERRSKNIASPRVGPYLSLHYPLPPRKVLLWARFFALDAMNGPLPAVLKFSENTDQAPPGAARAQP